MPNRMNFKIVVSTIPAIQILQNLFPFDEEIADAANTLKSFIIWKDGIFNEKIESGFYDHSIRLQKELSSLSSFYEAKFGFKKFFDIEFLSDTPQPKKIG